ncbi:MAG: hypothetical protein AAFZ18_38855 [Myxococcota bacterium]
MSDPRPLTLVLVLVCAAVACDEASDTAQPDVNPVDMGEADLGVSDAGEMPDLGAPSWTPQPLLDRWSAVSAMPGEPVSYPRAVALQGRIFVLGGRTLNSATAPGRNLTDVRSYDPASGAWQMHAPMPAAVDQPNIVATEDRIWILGARADRAVHAYDPSSDTWTSQGMRPGDLDVGASALATRGSEIWVAGGVTFSASNPRGARIKSFERFDSETGVWTSLPDMAFENGYFGAALIEDVLYTSGGSTEQGSVARPGQTFAFNLTQGTWNERALMPEPVSSFASATVDRRFYVIGGITGATGRINFEVQVYDPQADTWGLTVDMPTPRFAAGAVALDEEIYIVGGVRQASETEFVATTEVEVLSRAP